MGSFKTITLLYNNIKKAHPEWNDEQIRAETERYLNDVLKPMFSAGEIYDFFDDRETVPEGILPHRMPRYSARERRERRERAKIIRGGVYDYIAFRNGMLRGYCYKLNEDGTDPNAPGLSKEQKQAIEADARRYDNREEQRLFYYISPNASERERRRLEGENREIAFLFDTNPAHWEQYYRENTALLKNSGDPAFADMSEKAIREELEKGIRERRGDVLMKRARIAGALIEKMEAMSDPGLPAEELAANYLVLMQEQAICVEALSFLENAEKGRYILSDANKEYLRYLDRYQIPMANAAERIAACSNPICELIDFKELAECQCDEMGDQYHAEYTSEERGEPFQEKLIRKHTHYNQYVTRGVEDQLTNLFEDAARVFLDARDVINKEFQNTIEDYGFTLGLGGAAITCEQYDAKNGFSWKQNAGARELQSGRPIVVEQDGRVAVLCARYPSSCELVWDQPEQLFNHSLRYGNEMLLQQLRDSDQWYQTRSRKFKELRLFFESLAETAGEMENTAQSRDKIRQDYSELMRLCKVYLATKPENGVGKNTLEQGHIDVAKALQAYAGVKLRELNSVQRAREALQKYRGMTSAEIKADIARQKKYRVNAQRRESPGHWLSEQRDAYLAMNLPASLSSILANSSLYLIRNMTIDPGQQAQQILLSTPTVQNNVIKMVGAMVAAEMIRTEREANRAKGKNEAGPLERSFAENAVKEEDLQILGGAAADEVAGKSPFQMDSRELTNYVAAFPAKMLADELQAARVLKQDCEEMMAEKAQVDALQETAQYYGKGGFGLLGTFANENILPQIAKLGADISAGVEKADLTASRELMKNCVIYSMIFELKGDGPAKMLTMLRDPQATTQLKAAMDGAEVFRNLMAPLEAAAEDGKVPISVVSSAFLQRKPQRAAFSILQDQDAEFTRTVRTGGKGEILKKPESNLAKGAVKTK